MTPIIPTDPLDAVYLSKLNWDRGLMKYKGEILKARRLNWVKRGSTRVAEFKNSSLFQRTDQDAAMALIKINKACRLYLVLYRALLMLISTIFENLSNANKTKRSKDLTPDRATQLESELKNSRDLLKFLLHDISGPMMNIKMYSEFLKTNKSSKDYILENLDLAMVAMSDIIAQSSDRFYQGENTKELKLRPVKIEECFRDVASSYRQQIAIKNIKLEIENRLSEGTMALADKVSLTHGVLGNLVSNALKFSRNDSTIQIIAREQCERVVLDVIDQGPGISLSITEKLFNNDTIISTAGNQGEIGKGHGLSIVKSFVENYGGQIKFNNTSGDTNKVLGAHVQVTLNKALA